MIKKQNRKNLLNNNNGWTLTESVIAITIFTILGLVIMTLYTTANTLIEVGQNKLYLQQQARLSLDRILKELRQASPGSITINQSQNSITFQIPQGVNSNSGAITWSPFITYSVGGINNSQLLRTQAGSGTATVMANDVNNDLQSASRVRFVPDQAMNPNSITVTLGMTRNTLKGHAANAVLTGVAKVRNP